MTVQFQVLIPKNIRIIGSKAGGTGGPAKHASGTTQMRVPRPSRFCLGGDFILVGERLGILYHAACSRAGESQHTHPRK
jgi:hypothetical protein